MKLELKLDLPLYMLPHYLVKLSGKLYTFAFIIARIICFMSGGICFMSFYLFIAIYCLLH